MMMTMTKSDPKLDQNANQLPGPAETDDLNCDIGLLQRPSSTPPRDYVPGVCCICTAKCESLVFAIADLIICALLLIVSIVDLAKLAGLIELTKGRYTEVTEEDVTHSRNITHSRWEQGKLNYWKSDDERHTKILLALTRIVATVLRSIGCGLLIRGMLKRNPHLCTYWFLTSTIYIIFELTLQICCALLVKGDMSFWANFGLGMMLLISMQVYGMLIVANVVQHWPRPRPMTIVF